jgi:mannitol/fructose-specific phosphotransferase system IIA component (Ntr-type)
MDDYTGLDGKPIECVFAILVPQKATDLHLDILSGFSRRLMNQDFRDRLKNAKTAAEVLQIF